MALFTFIYSSNLFLKPRADMLKDFEIGFICDMSY